MRAFRHITGLIQAIMGLLFCYPILAADSQVTANLASARLALAANTNIQQSEISVDMAPFARVVSWDPNRRSGANSNRTEEVRTENMPLEKALLKQADGSFLVPSYKKRLACVGLEWLNPRTLKELHLEFAYPGQIPLPRNTQVEGWFGESASQGDWKKLQGTFRRTGNGVTFYLTPQNQSDAILSVQKVRWIFLGYSSIIKLREISAFTRSHWDTMNLIIEAEKPLTKSRGTIEVINGQFVGNSDTNWNFKHPIHLKVCYSRDSLLNSDPTMLQFKLPTGSFDVAMEQIQTNECIYLPAHSLFIARESVNIDLATYKKKFTDRKSPVETNW